MKLKRHKKNLNRVREHTSGVQNIFCIKSWIEEHRIHRLDSAAYSARIKSNLVELTTYATKLHIGCFALDCKISCKSYSELLKHAIDIWLKSSNFLLPFYQKKWYSLLKDCLLHFSLSNIKNPSFENTKDATAVSDEWCNNESTF